MAEIERELLQRVVLLAADPAIAFFQAHSVESGGSQEILAPDTGILDSLDQPSHEEDGNRHLAAIPLDHAGTRVAALGSAEPGWRALPFWPPRTSKRLRFGVPGA
jgi:hypothetical protein